MGIFFIEAVKKSPGIKILSLLILLTVVPRIQVIDNWNAKTNTNAVFSILEKECIKKKLNGYVFELAIRSEKQLKIVHDIGNLFWLEFEKAFLFS